MSRATVARGTMGSTKGHFTKCLHIAGAVLQATDSKFGLDPAIGYMKSKSAVIVDQHATVNHYSGPAFFASQARNPTRGRRKLSPPLHWR
jgi:hypothetical protein